MTPRPAAAWTYFPVFLRLQAQPVLVIGAGEVALRKLRLLLHAGAQPRVVAPQLHPEIQGWVDAGSVQQLGANYHADQLAGVRLVIAATDEAPLNQQVAADAQALGIWVNVVDDPEHSSYITPAIVDRAPVLLAISSAGAAPVLARRLRERLEALLPAGLGAVAEFMGRWREQVRDRIAAPARRRIWEAFLDQGGDQRVLAGDETAASQQLQQILDQPGAASVDLGEVYLVGAGPGDPDLLTLKALRLMQQADVVLYDRLVHPQILERVRRDADRIYVGKQRSNHSLPQDQINLELVRLAQQGKRVLRLKGGDPFIFGRGGEEIETLAAHQVPFQVVPGITAASGCAAYAGIPLTHRDHAQACIFVTGHPRKDGQLDLHWDQLVRPGQTVVIYMGLGSLPTLTERLLAHGMPADWPTAVVEHGTAPQQRVVVAALDQIVTAVAREQLIGPSLVILGQVVRLRDQLQWFGGTATSNVKQA